MDLWKLFFWKDKTLKPSRLEDIPITYIGEIVHNDGVSYERIIAGSPIPDSERRAYRKEYESYEIDLAQVVDALSGNFGFLDFREIRYASRLDSIYIAFIGVEPEYRRRNVGSRLLEKVEEIAADRLAPYIYGFISFGREDTVYPFFKRCGYKLGHQVRYDFMISKQLYSPRIYP